jgi:hypothetical protein
VCTDVYISVQVYTSECRSVGVCTRYCAGVSTSTMLYLLLQFLVWQLLYASMYTYVHAKGEYTHVYIQCTLAYTHNVVDLCHLAGVNFLPRRPFRLLHVLALCFRFPLTGGFFFGTYLLERLFTRLDVLGQLLYANMYTYVHAKGEYTSVYKGVCQCVRMCTSAYKCIQVSAEVSACVHVIVQE